MVVRIRVANTWLSVPSNRNPSDLSAGRSPRLEKFALAAALLLMPSALLAFTVGLCIIAFNLRGNGDFLPTHGLSSHWQVWICTAGILLLLARLLGKYAREPEEYPFSGERRLRP